MVNKSIVVSESSNAVAISALKSVPGSMVRTKHLANIVSQHELTSEQAVTLLEIRREHGASLTTFSYLLTQGHDLDEVNAIYATKRYFESSVIIMPEYFRIAVSAKTLSRLSKVFPEFSPDSMEVMIDRIQLLADRMIESFPHKHYLDTFLKGLCILAEEEDIATLDGAFDFATGEALENMSGDGEDDDNRTREY